MVLLLCLPSHSLAVGSTAGSHSLDAWRKRAQLSRRELFSDKQEGQPRKSPSGGGAVCFVVLGIRLRDLGCSL